MVIKTSLIDWIGEFEGGVGAFIGLVIDDTKTIECVYWTHPDGRRGVKIEQSFLQYFKVSKEEHLPFISELLDDIESILPDKKEIFENFLKT